MEQKTDLQKKHRRSDRRFIYAFFTMFFLMYLMIAFDVKRISNDLEKTKIETKTKLDGVIHERDSLKLRIDSLHVLNWDNIEFWIDTLDIAHKEIVMRQIALETGNLTSDICLYNHNLFGMKEPRVRNTTAIGTKRGHAYYSNYIESIKDYKLWQDDRRAHEYDDYYALLHSVGYAEAVHYINALKSISI